MKPPRPHRLYARRAAALPRPEAGIDAALPGDPQGHGYRGGTRQPAESLQRLDLYDHRQKKIQDLSRGMQQKAQLIATLVHEPDLIVVDEPFANLDPLNTRLALEILEDARAPRAKRSSCRPTSCIRWKATCNRIVLINKGRSVLYGEVDKIKRDLRRTPSWSTARAALLACQVSWTCARRTTTGACPWRKGPSRRRSFGRWLAATISGSTVSSSRAFAGRHLHIGGAGSGPRSLVAGIGQEAA